MKKSTGIVLLALVAMMWGMGFVAQDVGAESLSPLSFLTFRLLLASVSLIPVILVSDKTGLTTSYRQMDEQAKRNLLRGGLCCGLILTAGAVLLQYGVAMGTEPGKAGFISALYIVIVPAAEILFGKKVPFKVWISVALCCTGLYFLCVKNGFSSVELGDVLIMLSAVCYSAHIMSINHFSPRTDGIKLSFLHMLIAGLVCAVGSLLFETFTFEQVLACLLPLLYTGVVSSGIAYTLQIIAQKAVPEGIASLILSMESLFAAIFGVLILGNTFTVRELIGCALMIGGVLLAQSKLKKA